MSGLLLVIILQPSVQCKECGVSVSAKQPGLISSRDSPTSLPPHRDHLQELTEGRNILPVCPCVPCPCSPVVWPS